MQKSKISHDTVAEPADYPLRARVFFFFFFFDGYIITSRVLRSVSSSRIIKYAWRNCEQRFVLSRISVSCATLINTNAEGRTSRRVMISRLLFDPQLRISIPGEGITRSRRVERRRINYARDNSCLRVVTRRVRENYAFPRGRGAGCRGSGKS